jgi:hypothetical protein
VTLPEVIGVALAGIAIVLFGAVLLSRPPRGSPVGLGLLFMLAAVLAVAAAVLLLVSTDSPAVRIASAVALGSLVAHVALTSSYRGALPVVFGLLAAALAALGTSVVLAVTGT